MKTRTYQFALAAAVAVCILLAAALLFVVMHGHLPAMETASQDVVVARGPDKDPKPMPAGSPAPDGAEPALNTIQLSPQRLQEIGVTTALVELKNIDDKLSAPGGGDQ